MSYDALILSHSISPRIEYIIDFLSDYYSLSFRLTSDEEMFKSADAPCKINYSYHRIVPDEIFIHAHVIMTETYVRQVKVECFEKRSYDGSSSYPAFFRMEGDEGFDLFAAIFYLITRYEEYLPHQKDSYGRFSHEASVAFRNGFLELPLVNIWLEDFRQLLAEKNKAFKTSLREFRFLPTYDIDMAWSFRNKGFRRNAGAITLLLLQLRFKRAAQRLLVLRGKTPDPFDAYHWMDMIHRNFNLHPVYFFLVAGELGRYDRNIDISHPEFIHLLKQTAETYSTGLHPSWASGDHPNLIKSEKHWMEKAIGRKVQASRQHYIRFSLPATYQELIEAGITDDYSMGYGSINGFRASYAASFYWFDLKNDRKTSLIIHPFCFMDANSYYEQHASPSEALDEMLEFAGTIKRIGGRMITVWHNSFLGTDPEFKGWRETYFQFIQKIISSA